MNFLVLFTLTSFYLFVLSVILLFFVSIVLLPTSLSLLLDVSRRFDFFKLSLLQLRVLFCNSLRPGFDLLPMAPLSSGEGLRVGVQRKFMFFFCFLSFSFFFSSVVFICDLASSVSFFRFFSD